MVSSEEILQFLDQNQGMSDADIAYNMLQYGVSPQQIIAATGESPRGILERYSDATQELGMAPSGLAGRESAIDEGLSSALESIAAAAGQGRGDIQSARDTATGQAQESFDQGREFFRPYAEGGQQAFDQQLALSGASGQAAFDQANMESPYTRFLQEEGERAVTRNASAMGGLGGGNVMQELQRRGQGLAQQGLQQQYNNLSPLSGMGMASASGQAGLSGTEGQVVSGITSTAGRNMADISMNAGQQASQAQLLAGQFRGQGRTDAGNMIASQQNQTYQNMSNLAQNQGQGMSGLYGQGTSNLADLLSNYALQGTNLNLAQGQNRMDGARMYGGQSGIPGVQQNTGMLGQIGQAAGGIGTMIGALNGPGIAALALSDERLKDNIQYTHDSNGARWYSWQWKPEHMEMTQGMPTTGVIAQEVALTHPAAVVEGPHGFLMVDYSKVM